MAGVNARGMPRASLVTLVALLAIAGVCWWYLFDMAADMSAMSAGGSMMLREWTPVYFVMMFVMWSVMMVAMMVPSAAPMILLYRQVARTNRFAQEALGTGLFCAGYFVLWTLFSLIATTLQWRLEEWALLSPMMRSQSIVLSGVILIGAGLYQFSSLKQACLKHCRGPLFFITRHWRPGMSGAFKMGIIHGAYCVGCCWAFMALLFVGGIMDLLMIAALAVIVLLEKMVPGGEWLAKGVGVTLIALGIVVIASA
ncbi:MAG: DUF2182 domain-containing protein [Marinobacter sp.]|nr:DUF2182 domain-containing protein [Marinobacter sp.]